MKYSNVNFGSYSPEDAERLKVALREAGIGVEVVRPGTIIGPEKTAGARGFAFTLLINSRDYSKARVLRKRLNARPLDSIPQPAFAGHPTTRRLTATFFISLIAVIIQGIFFSELYLLVILIIAMCILGMLTVFHVCYLLLKSKRSKKHIEKGRYPKME